VVIIAVVAGLATDHEGGSADDLKGPLVSAVTGTTDQLTQGEALTGPTVPVTPGRVEPSEKEWAALLPELQDLIAANPNDVNAQRKLALAYYNLGRLDEASAIYERLLTAKEDPVLRNRLGNTLRDLGDPAAAETAYRQAISDDPALAPPYLNLAELLWRQGRDTEALAVLDRGLAKVPEESRIALQKGRNFLKGSQ
jgi:tetratricopeptide (TPR) repeat protein